MKRIKMVTKALDLLMSTKNIKKNDGNKKIVQKVEKRWSTQTLIMQDNHEHKALLPSSLYR